MGAKVHNYPVTTKLFARKIWFLQKFPQFKRSN